MAANMVPERVAWAVDMLNVAPDDQLLEIGCGAGQAVSLICQRLDTGAQFTKAFAERVVTQLNRFVVSKVEPAPPDHPGEASMEKR